MQQIIRKINMSEPHDIGITWCTVQRQHAQLPPQGPEAVVLLKQSNLSTKNIDMFAIHIVQNPTKYAKSPEK